MSLIIKGLDMPNKGYLTEITDVTIRQFADGKIQIEIPKTSMPYYRLYEAIQIPKGHGRLADDKEILARAEQEVDGLVMSAEHLPMVIEWILDKSDTFLEAEE